MVFCNKIIICDVSLDFFVSVYFDKALERRRPSQ